MSNVCLNFANDAVSVLAKTSNASSQWIWIAIGGLIAGAWYGLSRWNQVRKSGGGDQSSPQGLVHELALALKLSRVERSLLSEAAAARNLHDPAMVFVDPRILNGLAEARSAKSPEYAALSRKLFG